MDQRIDAFLGRIAEVRSSRPALREVCKAEFKAIEAYYSTENSRRVRITAYRNAMKQAGLPKYIWGMLRLPKARSQALKQEYALQVRTKGTDPAPIYDYQRLIDKALSCIGSQSYGVVVPGLCLLSGRRPVEICLSGDFCEGVDLHPQHVWFRGQAKTKDTERAEEAYAIPLLCDVPRFVDAWQRFLTLKDFSTYDSRSFADACNKSLREAYDRHFAPLMPKGTTLRNLRDAYALIAYHVCRPKDSHIAINLYLRQILGHNDELGQTAQSYQKFYLDGFNRPEEN